jgi:hypothetical protein
MRDLPAINLTGFEPVYGTVEYEWGDPVFTADGWYWKPCQYHAEILAWFEHDYLGYHAFAQVWDYAQQDDPEQRWQYVLLLYRPTRQTNAEGLITGSSWDWCLRVEYEGREDHRGPSYALVGADVEVWLRAPEVLRFIVE